MKQEDKELLLKDLCARLPYGVKCKVSYNSGVINDADATLYGMDKDGFLLFDEICGDHREFLCKPYLFPLSSMTEEQKIKCFKGTPLEIDKYGDVAVKDDFYGNSMYTDLEIYLEVIDWLNKNHFDYRGLIEKGLAIDATNLNIY